MPPPSEIPRFMNVVGWSLPMNYQPVHDCLRALGMPPYDQIEKETLSRVIERNWRTILLIVSTIAAILAGSTVLAVIARYRLAQSQKILARQASLLEQTSDGVFAVDAGYRITYWNRAACQLRGLSYQDVVGRRAEEILPWPGAGPEHESARRKFESDGCWQDRIQLRGPAGAVREVELAATAIRGAGREFAGAVVGLRDITERKNLEEQLFQSQKMQAVGLLAGGVAHDFNNLLTVINGYAEIALGAARRRGEPASNLDQILAAGRRAAELTQQLLAFSRKQILQPRAINLNALLSDMGQLLRRLIGENIELAVDLAPALPLVQADPGQIQQVILNLVVNARDATPPGGAIRLFTANVGPASVPAELRGQSANGFVLLTVADTGSGMDEAVRQRVFEPFFTTKELGKGTGLGLSTVYGIVRQSGGHIEVSSAPGEGSWFHVYLPAARVSEDSAGRPAEPLGPASGNECALVVEDQPDVRAFACEVLRGAGYRVIEAESPRAALDLARDEKLDVAVLLTDVVMPVMSGPELARALRVSRPAMKVLYMSGYAEDQVALHEAPGNGTAFIEKPFSIRDLELKVRGLLDGLEPLTGSGTL
jgi:two-component system, cell cycle sensor histidine kinase and response regulator CckA